MNAEYSFRNYCPMCMKSSTLYGCTPEAFGSVPLLGETLLSPTLPPTPSPPLSLPSLCVGSVQPHPLHCLAIQGKVVFAAYGGTIKAFVRGKEVNCYLGHEGDVMILLPLGEHLVSIDDRNALKIWHRLDHG